jgi:hypothetical protein
MPNWCANGLRITAHTEEQQEKLRALHRHVEQQDGGICSFFFPCPQELQDTVAGYMSGEEGEKLKKQEEYNLEKYGSKNWYDWQISNWGTKWDPDVQHQTLYNNDNPGINVTSYECYFDSAWSPPIGFYNNLYELGYEVEATYNECGCDFIGWYHDGDDHCYGWGDIKDEYEEEFAQLQDSPKPTDEDSDEAWEWDTMITDFSQERFFDDAGYGDLIPNGWGG